MNTRRPRGPSDIGGRATGSVAVTVPTRKGVHVQRAAPAAAAGFVASSRESERSRYRVCVRARSAGQGEGTDALCACDRHEVVGRSALAGSSAKPSRSTGSHRSSGGPLAERGAMPIDVGEHPAGPRCLELWTELGAAGVRRHAADRRCRMCRPRTQEDEPERPLGDGGRLDPEVGARPARR